MLLRILAQRCRRFSPLLAAPAALLLIQGQAKAFLTYNIFESGGNVVVQTSGSLDLPGATGAAPVNCNLNGAIVSSLGAICTGIDTMGAGYLITGPTVFNGTVDAFGASSVSGIFTGMIGTDNKFYIDPAYTSATPIVSSATFNGTTLAALGFTTTGLIGTWTLNGTSESIQVFLGPPTPSGAAVPGPLPLFGVAAAFGWSRRLRKRITAPLITPPQA
jgi:hypothetical protein